MDDNNKPIMTKTPLCYFLSEGKNGKKTQWLMDQYKLINEGDNPSMLKNWVLFVIHYKPKKSSNTDLRSEALGLVCSSAESSPQISYGINDFNVASSSDPSPEPEPFQTPSNPKKRQQCCSTSYDQPLETTCPSNNIAFHSQLPKRRSPVADDTPDFDQKQASQPSFDQTMVSDVLQDPDIERLLNLNMHDFPLVDNIFDLFPSELNPQDSKP